MLLTTGRTVSPSTVKLCSWHPVGHRSVVVSWVMLASQHWIVGEYLLDNYRRVNDTSSHKFLFEGTITRGASKRTERTPILNAGDARPMPHTVMVGGS